MTRGRQVRYWAERIKSFIHQYPLHEKWLKLADELGIPHLELSEPALRQEHRHALQTYKQYKKDAIPLRDRYLEDLAEAYAQGNEQTKAKKVRALRKKKKVRQMYQHITTAFKGPRAPLSSLLMPDAGAYKLTTDPEVIHPALCAVNKRNLQASSISPFVTGPLSSIGPDGLTTTSEDILDGTFDHSSDNTVLTRLIYHLQRTCPQLVIDFSDDTANLKRFRLAIAITPEKASSSPSGIHYGIYKTVMTDDYLATVMAQLASIPFKHGFVLHRWTNVTQVMIKKKPEPYIDQLRIIELFEGDYVCLVKGIMRTLMHHLWDNDVKGHGTFATQTGGSTHLAIASRVWAYDVARIKRCPIATLDNDSSGCYDRMAPPLLSILLRRAGLSEEITRTFIHQLLLRQRKVQTAYGLSDTTEVEQGEYMGGIGQGNPGGPTCYHLQLLPLLLVMRDLTQGFTATDPTHTIKYLQHVASYVDDCNSLIGLKTTEQNLNIQQQLDTITQRAQHTLTTWYDLIRTTGEDIKLSKSLWTFCSRWDEKRGKLYPTAPPIPVDLMIDGTPYPMKPPTTCERYLGVRVGISGAMDDEYTYRLTHSREFASEVYKLTSREEATLVYRGYYLSKFGYPLPVTTFTTAQLKRIESPSIQAILVKLGYNRHFPRCVVFGPIEWGGLGLQSLRSIQGYQQIKLLLRALNTETDVTPLLKILLRYSALEAGTTALFS